MEHKEKSTPLTLLLLILSFTSGYKLDTEAVKSVMTTVKSTPPPIVGPGASHGETSKDSTGATRFAVAILALLHST